MKNSNKNILFLSLIISLTFLLSAFASAQTTGSADTVEVIKYGTAAQTPVPQSDNVLINRYSADFAFTTGAAEKNPNVCICSTSYDKVYITNTAAYDAVFTISTNAPEYATIPFNTLQVAAGQTAEVLILLSASCNENEKITSYNLLVSNNFGTQYTIERELQINRCQSIEATLYASSNTILPCEKANYTIELKNPSTFQEQYTISLKNTQFFDNSKYEATLAPGAKSYFNFTYAPDCNVYGEKNIEFEIKSVFNKLSANLQHALIIEKAYDFEVTAPQSADLCREASKTVPITIKNNARMENEFFLTIVNKQDFLTSDAYYAKLAPGEEATFTITGTPGKTAKTEQVLDFEIKTSLGDATYRGKVNLNVRNCYILAVNIISDTNPQLCSGTHEYIVNVQNIGDYRERIVLSDNSETAEVFPSTIILNSGESENVSLLLSLPDEEKTTIFKVAATLDNGKQWEDEITVKSETKYDCALLTFNKDRLVARYGDDNTSFSVTNNGRETATYSLRYEGEDFISLATENITLMPGETGRINLTLYADTSEANKKYTFKIIAASSNGAEYENDMTLKMTKTPLLQRIYNAATTNSCTSVSSLAIILLVLGIIAVAILAWKRVRVPLAFKLIALAVILIIIISVLVFEGLPESRKPAIDKSQITPTNLIWYEDHSKKIDLNEYFYDPDNDTLTYAVDSEPENISISIEGSSAKMVPDKDWFGTARVRFTASDNFGGDITSERINLEVVEVPEFSYEACYMNNCGYINALLFILFFALIFLLRTRKEKDRLSRKVAFVGVKKQKGFLYFLDKDGDVSRVPMARRDKPNQKFRKEKVGKTVAVRKK